MSYQTMFWARKDNYNVKGRNRKTKLQYSDVYSIHLSQHKGNTKTGETQAPELVLQVSTQLLPYQRLAKWSLNDTDRKAFTM